MEVFLCGGLSGTVLSCCFVITARLTCSILASCGGTSVPGVGPCIVRAVFAVLSPALCAGLSARCLTCSMRARSFVSPAWSVDRLGFFVCPPAGPRVARVSPPARPPIAPHGPPLIMRIKLRHAALVLWIISSRAGFLPPFRPMRTNDHRMIEGGENLVLRCSSQDAAPRYSELPEQSPLLGRRCGSQQTRTFAH